MAAASVLNLAGCRRRHNRLGQHLEENNIG